MTDSSAAHSDPIRMATVYSKPNNGMSFAKTRSPVVSTTWEMGGNVAELGYMRPRRGILKSDDILPKDTEHRQAVIFQDSVLCLIRCCAYDIISFVY